MIFNTTSGSQGKVRPVTNRLFASLIVVFTFFAIATPVFGQSSSIQTTVHLEEAVSLNSQVIVENILAGDDLYAGVTMEEQLLNGEELLFSVNGLEAALKEGQAVAIVKIFSEGQIRTFVFQGGGGNGGYIIGIEDL